MYAIKIRYLLLLMLLTACAPQTHNIYYWGAYEPLLYDMYATPGKADPATQIERLNADIQQAAADGKPVPPGLYAHLGSMYAELGQGAAAKAALLEEQRRYPESSLFIQGLLERAGGEKP